MLVSRASIPPSLPPRPTPATADWSCGGSLNLGQKGFLMCQLGIMIQRESSVLDAGAKKQGWDTRCLPYESCSSSSLKREKR